MHKIPGLLILLLMMSPRAWAYRPVSLDPAQLLGNRIGANDRAEILTPTGSAWVENQLERVSEILRSYANGNYYDETGVSAESIAMGETMAGVVLLPLDVDRLSMALHLGSRTRYISDPYVFSSYEGGFGVEYLVGDWDQGLSVFAVRFSPVYVEVAVVRLTREALGEPVITPLRVLGGPQAEVEFSWKVGPVVPGIRAAVRPQWELNDDRQQKGLSYDLAIYHKINLSEIMGYRGPPSMEVTPTFSYFFHGGAKDDLFHWVENLQLQGRGRRGAWQIMIPLKITW